MRFLRISPVHALPGLLLLVAGPVAAQRSDIPISVQVVSGEQLARTGTVDVLKSLEGVRTPIGTARAGAPLQIRALGQGFRQGDPISVTYHRNQLVLIDGRQPDPACLADLNALPANRCQQVEVIRAGSGAVYGVDAIAGVVNIITRPLADDVVEPTLPTPGYRVRLGLDYTMSSFYKLNDVACNTAVIPGLGACDSDNSSNGIGVYGEVRLNERFSLGGRYSYNSYLVNQQYGNIGARHDVGVKAFDVYSKVHFASLPKFDPYALIGASWYENYDENYWDDVPYAPRKESGFRILGGLGGDYELHRKIDLRAMVRLATGGGNDADSNLGGGLGLSYRF